MDWATLLALALLGGFILWRHSKTAEKAKVASDRLKRDTRTYQHIKIGMREYEWRRREPEVLGKFFKAKNGELLFETADLSAFRVEHFAESRVGFYFKDIDEYGLYGLFVGNDPDVDVFENYYRTDRTFQEEQQLLYEDE